MTTVCFLFKKIVKIVICLPTKHLEFLWTCLNVSVRSRSNWYLEVLVLRRGDNWSIIWKKTSWRKGENLQQTQPTDGFDTGTWTRATLVGGECSHHRPTLGPLFTLCWSVSSGISMQWCHWLLLSIQGEVIYLLLDLAFVWPEELCWSRRVLWAFVPWRPFCPMRVN